MRTVTLTFRIGIFSSGLAIFCCYSALLTLKLKLPNICRLLSSSVQRRVFPVVG